MKLEFQNFALKCFKEFMAHIVLPNGQTVGEAVTPRIEQAYQTGEMPPLLGYSGDSK